MAGKNEIEKFAHDIIVSFTVKALSSPRGLIQFRTFQKGGLLAKSSDKDIFGSFAVLLSHICGINIQFHGSNA